MIPRPKRLLYVINEEWYFRSHYRSWALRASQCGYEVHVAMRLDSGSPGLDADPIRVHPLRETPRGGLNPFEQVRLIHELFQLYRTVNPDLVHHITLNLVFCGSIAARTAGVPRIVNAITGLGHLFVQEGMKTACVRSLVLGALKRLTTARNSRFIVSNPDDRMELLRRGVVAEDQVVMIPGSGIDPDAFPLLSEPRGTPVVMLASRVLWPKGIESFVEAARMLGATGAGCRMVLVGDSDPGNPTAVPRRTVEEWRDDALIEWWGHSANIVDSFRKANIVCLPSQREGLPRVLLEAASCGRALVATDVPGCREICRHEENGLLVPPSRPDLLANAIRRLIEDHQLRKRFAKRGREIVVERFSLGTVTELALETYGELLAADPRG